MSSERTLRQLTFTTFRGGKQQEAEDGEKDEHKSEHQPAKVMHGEDNTDKSVEEIQHVEEVPQACVRGCLVMHYFPYTGTPA